MKKSTIPHIQPLWPSGRCLPNYQLRKRRNSFVRIFVYCHPNAPNQSHQLSQGLSVVTNHSPLSPVFLTGSDRVPFLGMKSIKMTVAVLPNATEIALPESLTCHFLLLLPIYQGSLVDRIMHTRLLQAINNKSGHGKNNESVQ